MCDHIMMEKHRTSTGSSDPKDLKEARVLYSDELECFEIFKENTGGVIHQHKLVKVTESNQDFVAKQCKYFTFDTIPNPDPSSKKKPKYTYKYFGTEYPTLKALNKHGVYITIDIHFDTLLDIIPYYPYIVCMGAYSNGREEIIISAESEVISRRDESLEYGHLNGWESDTKRLQQHYLEVCKNYYLYKLDERVRIVPIKDYHLYDDQYYFITVPVAIDYLHEMHFVWNDGRVHSHWTSPELRDRNKILIHRQDIEHYLKDDIAAGTVSIRYVEKCEFPLHLT